MSKAQDHIIVDVRSDSVACALLSYDVAKHKSKVIFEKRVMVELDTHFNAKRTIPRLTQALREVLTLLGPHVSGGRPAIHVIMGSPWYIGQTRLIHLKHTTPVAVSETLFQSIIDEEIEAMFGEHNLSPKDHVVRTNLHSVRLNGYKTRRWKSRKADTIDIATYVALYESKIMTPLDREIHQRFNIDRSTLNVFPYMAMKSLPDVKSVSDDFVIIDINGEATEIVVVKDDVISETTSFPIGFHSVVRSVAIVTHSSIAEAQSLVVASKDGRLGKNLIAKVARAMDRTRDQWGKAFGEAMKRSSYQYLLPENIFAIGPGSITPLFCACIDERDVTMLTTKNEPFSVTIMTRETLAKTRKEGECSDPLLYLEQKYLELNLASVLQ